MFCLYFSAEIDMVPVALYSIEVNECRDLFNKQQSKGSTMTYEIIENLVEQLSSAFALVNPEDLESLSGLLPILKQIHGQCMKNSLNRKAKEVLKARKIINSVIKSASGDVDKKMAALGKLISELPLDLPSPAGVVKKPGQALDNTNPVMDSSKHKQAPDSSNQIPDKTDTTTHSPVIAPDVTDLDQIEQIFNKFSSLVAGFCPGEIPDLAAMLNTLDDMIEASADKKFFMFNDVSITCKGYVELMTLEDVHSTKPVEDALVLLRSILTHFKSGKVFPFDYSDVIKLLNGGFNKNRKTEETALKKESSETAALQESEKKEEDPERAILQESEKKEEDPERAILQEPEKKEEAPERAILQESEKKEEDPERAVLQESEKKEEDPEAALQEPEKIQEDDLEILIDFVAEADENLDTIEVNLIELEQEPSDKDIINNIFRPFHTIKGVSGFLALKKINKLAHTTESLLDGARSGDYLINNTATDAILESVDTLKELIARVRQGTETGFKLPDDDVDTGALRDKLQKLQVSLTKGEKAPLGEILVQKEKISSESLEHALQIQKECPDKKIGEILVEEKKVSSKQIASALMEQNVTKKPVSAQVKVSTEKLDDLVDFAGELVIAQSMLRQKTSNDSSLSQNVAQLGLIVSNMQNIAMSMRMIPIKATFMKMIRLVRDLARKSGKDVSLNMFGEETEIDRNVVDALYEPMVHMIRNSVDHGIEQESDRLERGKPSQGNIYLRAYHKGGHIIIEIEDDGKGLDKERILEKAKNTGLITDNEQLSDGQIYDLILQPGFSTAKVITDVSGRGVGMDVVKSGIEKFRGQLNIESSKGAGTKFIISLPLTLAIIDGMLVRVDDEKYVIPTTAIQKAFKPGREDCFTVGGKGEMVKDRGNLIPLIRLNEIYNSSSKKKIIRESLVVVVESKDEKRALLIDELLGKDEYVIKSLGTHLENIEGLSGGAILADGRVGLILDIHGIFSLVSRNL